MASVKDYLIIGCYYLAMLLREAIFNVIAPYDCLLCTAEGRLVCEWCWPSIFEQVPERCFVCRRQSLNAATCLPCRRAVSLSHVWVVTPYRAGAKELVRAMKIDCQRQACDLIARAMHEVAPVISPETLVTSVPTALARIRERGFDHSGRIAQEFARLRCLEYCSLLARQGRTKQAGASKAQRAEQIKGQYQLAAQIPQRPPILLIDDVTTTGATLAEIAKVLSAGGVNHIDALIFAQAIQ